MVTVPAASRRLLAEPLVRLLGAVGFLSRGGIVLFSVPFWTIPSPVGLTLLVPPDAIGAAGPSPRLVALGVAVSALLLVAVIGAMIASALCEVALYERLVGGPRQAAAGRAAGGARVRLAAGLIAIEAVALLPVFWALAIAVRRLVEVGRAEFLSPGDLSVPFAVRVIGGARPELLVLGASILLADLIYGSAARWLLARRRPDDLAHRRPGDHAPRSRSARAHAYAIALARRLGAWLGSWAITLVSAVPGVVITLAVWRLVGLAAYGSATLPGGALALGLAVVAFVLCWCAAVAVAGSGSVVRGVLVSLADAR